MLLIGSRAIRYHLPDFREPVDWDLVGTTADIRRLDELLGRAERERRIPAERLLKAHYSLGDTLVEVANADRVPYWNKVLQVFAQAPTIDAGVLGQIRVASLDYILLTKQCGLVYDIVHWHKNLEDVYYLRERVPAMPEEIAALWPLAVQDSQRMFARGHRHATQKVSGCYPGRVPPAQRPRHRMLHELLALGSTPRVDHPGAWDGFPDATPTERLEWMIELMAEEAMVVAAERRLRDQGLVGHCDRAPDDYLRSSLRALIVGDLPVRWRYFCVNQYREIRASVPSDWAAPLADVPSDAVPTYHRCTPIAAASCRGRARDTV